MVVAVLVLLAHERLAREPVASRAVRAVLVAEARWCRDAQALFFGADGAVGALPVRVAELEEHASCQRADVLLWAVEVFEAEVGGHALCGRPVADLVFEAVAVDAAFTDREAAICEALLFIGAVRVLAAGADELAQSWVRADMGGRAVADVVALYVDEAVAVDASGQLARAVGVVVALDRIDTLTVLTGVIRVAIVARVAAGAVDASPGFARLAAGAVAVAEADATPGADSAFDAEEPSRAVEVTAALDFRIWFGATGEVADPSRRAISVSLAGVRRSRNADSGDTGLGARAVSRVTAAVGYETAAVVTDGVGAEERASIVAGANPRWPTDRVVATPQRWAALVVAAGHRDACSVLAAVVVRALRVDVTLRERLARAARAVRCGRAIFVSSAGLPALTHVVDAEAERTAILVDVARDRGDALARRELTNLVVVAVIVGVAANGRADPGAALFAVVAVLVVEALRRDALIGFAGPRSEAVAVKDALELGVLAEPEHTCLAVVTVLVRDALGFENALSLDAPRAVAFVVGRASPAWDAASAAALFAWGAHQVRRTSWDVDTLAAAAHLSWVTVEQVAALGAVLAESEVALLPVRAVFVELAHGLWQGRTGPGVARLTRCAVTVVDTTVRFLADATDAAKAERTGVVALTGDAGPADTAGALPVGLAVGVLDARSRLACSEVAALPFRTLCVGRAVGDRLAPAAWSAE